MSTDSSMSPKDRTIRQCRKSPSTVMTHLTTAAPAAHRSIAFGVYTGAAPRISVGCVIPSLNGMTSPEIASDLAGGSSPSEPPAEEPPHANNRIGRRQRAIHLKGLSSFPMTSGSVSPAAKERGSKFDPARLGRMRLRRASRAIPVATRVADLSASPPRPRNRRRSRPHPTRLMPQALRIVLYSTRVDAVGWARGCSS
jgi:hypothetical protein